MLEEANLTGGIGARTALSIRCISTKKPQQSLPQTSAINAKQKNATEIANMQNNMNLQMLQSSKQEQFCFDILH